MQRYTLDQFLSEFQDDDACLDWLFHRRWPNGVHCEKCDRVTAHHRMKTRKSYSCSTCGNHVHPTADTIFHKSSTPLHKWFYAVFLMSSTRCGISAKQIEREVGVTYKTAWRMAKQIRSMLGEDDQPLFRGEVEMDESQFGGRRKSGAGRKPSAASRTMVAGIIERRVGGTRTGRVVAKVVPDTSGDTLLPMLRDRVLRPVTVFTDEYRAYGPLSRRLMMHHRRINHSTGVYVNGNVHTNTIEGFWSLVKNGVRGVYHSVGKGYLQTYLNEYAFRYNHRKDETPMFTTMLRLSALSVVSPS